MNTRLLVLTLFIAANLTASENMVNQAQPECFSKKPLNKKGEIIHEIKRPKNNGKKRKKMSNEDRRNQEKNFYAGITLYRMPLTF